MFSCSAAPRGWTPCSTSSTRRFAASIPARHIVVDCLDYRKNKDSELRETARLLAERARATGEPQEIGPLNPYARRIVHLAIAENPGVTSESVGDAFLKSVVISASGPESAP